MATSEELNAAVERYRKDDYGSAPYWWAVKSSDEITLSEAYMAHIAEQERVAAERAMSITEEWLVSIGTVLHYETYSIGCVRLKRWSGSCWTVWIFDRHSQAVVMIGKYLTTRGEVFDLLTVLKIPMKGA